MTRKEAERWGVQVLPMLYSIQSMPLSEGYLDENGRFCELLQKNARNAHTSQVRMSAFMGAFNELLRKGTKAILCITISSRLSGTYSNAVIAARELGGAKIVVVDSLSTAAGMRFLVKKAVELSREGVDIEQAADILEGMREKIGTVLSVDDMDALRRSGRLGLVRQSVGTILNIRPVLYCKHGTVVAGQQVRGQSGQISGLVKAVPANAKYIEILSVMEKPALELLEKALRARFSCSIHQSLIGPVLAIHIGLSAIGIAWMTEDE